MSFILFFNEESYFEDLHVTSICFFYTVTKVSKVMKMLVDFKNNSVAGIPYSIIKLVYYDNLIFIEAKSEIW